MKKNIIADSTSPNSKIAILSAWIVCIVIILFSYIPFLNIVAKITLAVFFIWFSFKAFIDMKNTHWPAPLLLYLAWGIYALIPSVFGPEPENAMFKWFAIGFIGLTNVAIANAVVWSGSVKPWLWAYLFASVVSYYVPLQLLPLVAYENEVFGRHVGTLGNANTYGCTMVQAALLALILLLQEKRLFFRMLILSLILLCTLEVVASGSRTALVGLILALLGAGYSVGISSLLKSGNLLFLFLSMLASFVTVILGFAMSQSESFTMIFKRMEILLVYVGLVDGAAVSKERSLYGRMDLMESAFETWLQYPLGIGLDNFKIFSGVYAHSNYFELLASVGLIGLVLYYFYYYKFYKQIMRKAIKMESVSLQRMFLVIIVVLLAMDISHVSYYSKSLWLLLSILSGYLILLEKKSKSEEIENKTKDKIQS